MEWRGRRQSDNIEDRRGDPSSGGFGRGGGFNFPSGGGVRRAGGDVQLPDAHRDEEHDRQDADELDRDRPATVAQAAHRGSPAVVAGR